MRRGMWALLFGLLGLPILFAVTGLAYVSSLLPPGQAERVTGPDGLVGVDTGGSYAWVVPVDGGVVLVDAGLDAKGDALRREVGGREVLGVLVTHGHADHTAGLTAFPEAPVWIASADRPYLAGTVEEKAPLALAYRKVGGSAAKHGELHDVEDGAEVRLGGASFRPVATPGVTPGHVAWLWKRVLFSGDAVWGGGKLQLPPDALVEDTTTVRSSATHLLPLDFDTLADGQVGVTSGARAGLHRLLDAELAPPTLAARADGGESRTGWLVRAPLPDVRGEQPEWLVAPGEPPLELSTHPVASRDEWVGRWVAVEGVSQPTGYEVRSVAAGTNEPSSQPPTSPKALEGWLDRFVSVEGDVRQFAPLAVGAEWGAGVFALTGEGAVALHAPVALIPGPGRLTLTARVRRDAHGRVELIAVGAPGH